MKLIRLLLAAVIIFSLGVGALAQTTDKIADAVLRFAVSNHPEWKGAELKVSLNGAESLNRKYPEQEISFTVPADFKLTRVTPRMTLPIAVIKDGEEIERGAVTARIEVFHEVVTAGRKLLKNQRLQPEDIIMQKMEVSLYPDKYFVDKNRVIGKISTTLVPQGAMLLSWMVKAQPVVARGETVRIINRSEGLLVEAQGEALQDGQIGDLIKVRRKNVKQSFEAQVIGAGAVEVKY
ncbi:flagellar basal body P-ring formation protein FlgA [Candidatus Saganbacteria bacterium]|nr:flagellar basal body P-ring formation protein FlgA [Candidatus Saganbacteria bacterium]